MTDVKIIDARGLDCPEPVMRTKKALETNSRIMVIVDNDMALENVKRLGTKTGCDIQVDGQKDGAYHIRLSRKGGAVPITDVDVAPICETEPSGTGPFVVVFAENRMGRGNDELGGVLIRAFIHTLAEQVTRPDMIIFYNTGVKLIVKDSPVLDDLKAMAEAGVELMVCGTCVNYFDIAKEVAVGNISNMYDIVGIMSRAGRLVMP